MASCMLCVVCAYMYMHTHRQWLLCKKIACTPPNNIWKYSSQFIYTNISCKILKSFISLIIIFDVKFFVNCLFYVFFQLNVILVTLLFFNYILRTLILVIFNSNIFLTCFLIILLFLCFLLCRKYNIYINILKFYLVISSLFYALKVLL